MTRNILFVTNKYARETFLWINGSDMTQTILPPLWTIGDLNSAAAGMMFGSDFIFYRDFSALRKLTGKIVVNFVGFIYVATGKIAITLNDISLIAEAGRIIFFKAGDFISDVMFSPDSDGMVCGIDAAVPFESRSSVGFPQLTSLKGNCMVFNLSDDVADLLDLYGRLLSRKYSMGIEKVRFTVISMMEDLLASVTLPGTAPGKMPSRLSAERLYQRFSTLLIESYPKPRDVRWYADALSVSPNYLARVVKQISGKTTLEWINEAVMTDVRTSLIHTDESIKEIAVMLGFGNPAFFGKYVKHHSGLTPKRLRSYLKTKGPEGENE